MKKQKFQKTNPDIICTSPPPPPPPGVRAPRPWPSPRRLLESVPAGRSEEPEAGAHRKQPNLLLRPLSWQRVPLHLLPLASGRHEPRRDRREQKLPSSVRQHAAGPPLDYQTPGLFRTRGGPSSTAGGTNEHTSWFGIDFFICAKIHASSLEHTKST